MKRLRSIVMNTLDNDLNNFNVAVSYSNERQLQDQKFAIIHWESQQGIRTTLEQTSLIQRDTSLFNYQSYEKGEYDDSQKTANTIMLNQCIISYQYKYFIVAFESTISKMRKFKSLLRKRQNKMVFIKALKMYQEPYTFVFEPVNQKEFQLKMTLIQFNRYNHFVMPFLDRSLKEEILTCLRYKINEKEDNQSVSISSQGAGEKHKQRKANIQEVKYAENCLKRIALLESNIKKNYFYDQDVDIYSSDDIEISENDDGSMASKEVEDLEQMPFTFKEGRIRSVRLSIEQQEPQRTMKRSKKETESKDLSRENSSDYQNQDYQ